MVITEILEKNARLYADDVALVEINPEQRETRRTWREYELIEPEGARPYRREITWRVFNEKANRFANASEFTTTRPATRSLCPPRYFVAL